MIWNNMPKIWRKASSAAATSEPHTADAPASRGDEHLAKARASIAALLDNDRLSASAHSRLAEDYQSLEQIMEKLEHASIYVAVFGRVSVGKSALLNALLGEHVFATSVLHGKTKHSARAAWHTVSGISADNPAGEDGYQQAQSGGVYLIDTPGIDEIGGTARQAIAERVAHDADIRLFIVDGDLSESEYEALCALQSPVQPLLLVLNKKDRYSEEECQALLRHLRQRCRGVVSEDNILAVAAAPALQEELYVQPDGREEWRRVRPAPDVEALRQRLWELLQKSGKSYAALNATLFAQSVADKIAFEIMLTKKELAEKVIRHYALLKSLGVALNPIPIVDLLALGFDAGMVVHLSKIYGFPLNRRQAGRLISTISAQIIVLMSAVYGVQAASSLLKGLSAGFSTVLTAGAQAGVAWYSTYIIGRAAQSYLAAGLSWGEKGAKQTLMDIIADLDEETLKREGRDTIAALLRREQGERDA